VTGAERAIRWSTVAAVTGVAIVAGWVSYAHALAVVRAHGESGIVVRLYPERSTGWSSARGPYMSVPGPFGTIGHQL
jgi:hypothetical protein